MKGVPVVSHNDTTHRVKQHLKHRLRAKGTGNNLGDGLRLNIFKNKIVRTARSIGLYLGGLNVCVLGFTAGLSLCISIENKNRCASHLTLN
jgi:hypothetical protein